ncbi:MAG: DmsE family decaheme c-type cytochrome [Acidobacteriia bacterium]|nr:DmsE family decaheme c-type cytochrome [Terriglobia bacterium]
MKTLMAGARFMCIVAAAVLWLGPFRLAAAAGSSPQDKSAAALPKDTAQYVGADVCKTCHEDVYKKEFAATPHFKTTLENGHGCESCHGPGSAHVEGGGDVSKITSFKSLSRQDASARCLSCHGEAHEQRRFAQSPHNSNDVGCLDCHSPHHAKEPQRLLVQNQPQLCYGCHTSAKADFAKPFHHRVEQGLIQCSDCHSVHGTGPVRQVRALPSGDFVCYKCHADKQGPFVYEHVPVKTEGCASCHTPHGSTNPRLLRVSQINLLCLQCHTFPTQGPIGPAHNQSQKYQACTMCHGAIHGSNFSNVFFK